MMSLGTGHRALPWAWAVEAGPAHLGFTTPQALLKRVRAWLPAGVAVLLYADRCYPSVDLFQWLAAQPGGHYRLRLKGNLNVDLGFGEITTTGAWAQGHSECYLSHGWLFNEGVPTNLAIGQGPGHPEPGIIAMNDPPHRATVHDDVCRWGIEPMFSDFKSRAFQLEDTQLQAADRFDRLLLIMTLVLQLI